MIDITNNDVEKSYLQVKNELKNYNSNLSKKKELIILNKIDLIDKSKVEDIVNYLSKSTKSEIITMSTFEKKTISRVKSKLVTYAS